MQEKYCVVCQSYFETHWKTALYCSKSCQSKAERQRAKIRRDEQNICTRCAKRPRGEGHVLCDECRAIYRETWKNRPSEDKQKYNAHHRKARKEKPEQYAEYNRRSNQKAKMQMLEHYGNICACCGEEDHRFLTIDHINGGGNAHRRQIFGGLQSGFRFYRWLRKNGYPEGFQILCYNCNMAKAWYGQCPHKLDKV